MELIATIGEHNADNFMTKALNSLKQGNTSFISLIN